MSRIEWGTLRWRSLVTGESGEGWGTTTHDEIEAANMPKSGLLGWIKGCPCDDCERARGGNNDEAEL